MKPFIHARISAKKFGGSPDDYVHIHDFLDSSKQCYASIAHRALLHNSFGIYLAEKVYGRTFINSDGKEIAVREVAEHHIIEDLGKIPTVEDWLRNLKIEPWMVSDAHSRRQQQKFGIENVD